MTKCERCGRDQPVGFEYGCGVCGWNTLAEKEQRERAEKAELKRDTYKAELAYHIGLPHCASITDLEKRLKEAEHIVAACKAWREYAAVEAAQGGCVQFVTMKMLAAILRGHKPLEQT